jgi:hypothetical protein
MELWVSCMAGTMPLVTFPGPFLGIINGENGQWRAWKLI